MLRLFPLHFLRAMWHFPKRIFIWSFFVLRNIFSTHIAARLFDRLSSDLHISLYATFTFRCSVSGRGCPKNIPGYASSSQYLSLKTVSGWLPSAGATLRIFCRSLSSKKSVVVNKVSVTPAGICWTSSLSLLCGKGLLVALWYSNVEGFAFHCFARLLVRYYRRYFLPNGIHECLLQVIHN